MASIQWGTAFERSSHDVSHSSVLTQSACQTSQSVNPTSLWVGTASSREDNTTCSTCIETGRLPGAVAQAIVHEYAAEEGDESVSLICLVMVNSTGETAQLYAGSADEEAIRGLGSTGPETRRP